MSKIHTIEISNFRGIKKFKQSFGTSDFICLIGRGDSGKTSIIEAISYVLSPNWNLSFYDSDFYNCDISKPIVIQVTLYNLPNKILQEDRFGLHIRGLKIGQDEIFDDLEDDHLSALTIRLEVDKDLEPIWHVVNARQEPKEIRASDRAALNVFLVSDYLDRHFSWSKGNPLYSILKEEGENEETNIIIDALREAKEKIDENPFNHLDNVIEKVKKSAADFGVDISNILTTIDFKDLSIKDGRICLHEEKIPFRLKGKGSKRLISIAIQSELIKTGGILLIDEIEQGLESDRVQHLARTLKKKIIGQVFVTTHSRDILVELKAENLFLMKSGAEKLIGFDNSMQGCLRNNPEAFFAKRVIVCEGATEIGICRVIDNNRIEAGKLGNTFLGIRLVDGTGATFESYCKSFIQSGFEVCAFCDSDDDAINKKKVELVRMGVLIVDCANLNSIEAQVFNDIPWAGLKELVQYRILQKDMPMVEDSISQKFGSKLPVDWLDSGDNNLRQAIYKASVVKNNEWFKRIDHGEFLGAVCYRYLNEMNGKKLQQQIQGLLNWIEK